MPTWFRVAFALFAIAFGANVFAPMLPVYKQLDHLSETQVTWIFAVYVAGLVPALLIGGPLSDRIGRRALIRPALLCSTAGSAIIIAGGVGPTILLSVGRLVAGAAVGLVMAAGAAWLKQVSSPAAGARRATVALSAGFGGGPLVGGVLAQWLPLPDVLPFALHLLLVVVATVLVWNVQDPPAQVGQRTLLPRTAIQPRFLLTVAAWAPWVFGTATISFAALTALTAAHTPSPVAYTGAIGGVTMLTGVAIQPSAQRLANAAKLHRPQTKQARQTEQAKLAEQAQQPGTNPFQRYIPPAVVGLTTATAGLLLGALVAATSNPWLVPIAAVLLGASYGIMMVSGLREVEYLAPPAELGAMIAVFYSLTYVGFFAPFALSILGPMFGYVPCLLLGAVVTAASIIPVTRVVAHPQHPA